jgi:2-methylisocitrate lyase-like PEP mutase family enzyme
LTKRLDKPQLMNMVIGGKTPIFGADDLAALGFGFVLYANAALQGALAGMSRCWGAARYEAGGRRPAAGRAVRGAAAAGRQAGSGMRWSVLRCSQLVVVR